MQANPLFITRISKITNSLLRNLGEVSEGHDPTDRMRTMNLHFKNDTEGKLWLLWLSNVDWKEDRHDVDTGRRAMLETKKKSAMTKTSTVNAFVAAGARAHPKSGAESSEQDVAEGSGPGLEVGGSSTPRAPFLDEDGNPTLTPPAPRGYQGASSSPLAAATGRKGAGGGSALAKTSSKKALSSHGGLSASSPSPSRRKVVGANARNGSVRSVGRSIGRSDDAAAEGAQTGGEGGGQKVRVGEGGGGVAEEPKWDNSKNVSETLYEGKPAGPPVAPPARTPAEIVGDRKGCFMTETTTSQRTKTREIYIKPLAATFAGKQKGEALRFGAMMQLSQRARREAAQRAMQGGNVTTDEERKAAMAATAWVEQTSEDGAEGAAASAAAAAALLQLSHALSGELMVSKSSKKKSKMRGEGGGGGGGGWGTGVPVDYDAKVLYAGGSHEVTLPHIRGHRRSGGGGGGGGKKEKGNEKVPAAETGS